MPEKPSFSASQYEEYLGDYKDEFTKVLTNLETLDFPKKIQNKDYTLWSNSPEEIVNRLGWLYLPETIGNYTESIEKFSKKITVQNFKSAVLLGMGGSSLAPELFASSFKDLSPIDIFILDSTDPDYILSVRKKLDLFSTIIIVSSKSGSTVETASLMNYFLDEYHKVMDREEIGDHFVSITDPGSDLEISSRNMKFREIFLNDPDIGGRFSALSFFGLVPASLTGLNLSEFIGRSGKCAALCKKNNININTGLRLGTLLGSLSEKGVNKLTIFTSDEISCFKFWIEQLVAESTGKNGKGILPVPEKFLDLNYDYGLDRVFVYIKLKGDKKAKKEIKGILNTGLPLVVLELEDRYDLACLIYLWEYATAAAAYIMRVNPFDQPDVESAKNFTREFVKKYKETGLLDKDKPKFNFEDISFFSPAAMSDTDTFLRWLSGNTTAGSYISVQAYITPDDKTELKIAGLSKILATRYKVPVTIGFGPRYLHSSGQLHKGDAGGGVFIQLTSDTRQDIPIPDGPFSENSSMSFAILKNAQALGDYLALSNKGRKIVSIDLGSDTDSNLQRLINLF